MNAFEEARAIEQEIIAWRRQIHQHPEIGQNLPQTAALVRQKLDEWGVEYREVIPNAFMAYIGKKGGHSILMRADMDALPMEEKNRPALCLPVPRSHALLRPRHPYRNAAGRGQNSERA